MTPVPDAAEHAPAAGSAAAYDPRPALAETPAGLAVAGWRCTACRYPVAAAMPACPVCGGDLAPGQFGPAGTVSASTCLHVRVPGRTPPYAVAYVDLDNGPRVLAHTPGLVPLRPGTRVRLGPKNASGDLTAQAPAGGAPGAAAPAGPVRA